MASAAQEIRGGAHMSDRHGRRRVAVIADWGDGASVVLVAFARSPLVGDRFQLHGCDWEITRDRDHVRTYVARRVRQRR